MQLLAEPAGKMGRPEVFFDVSIQLCLSVTVLVKLPLRQAVGMVRALLKLARLDWADQDKITLCGRQKTLAVNILHRRADGPLNLLMDIEPKGATGSSERARAIKLLGDGQWHARKHGPSLQRQRRKIHPAMDTAKSNIRAVEFTFLWEGHSPTLPALLDQILEDEQIGPATTDGAFAPTAATPRSSSTRPRRSSRSARTVAWAGRLPGRCRSKRNPPRFPPRRPRRMETTDPRSCQKQGRGREGVLERLRRTVCCQKP